jgi:hypothetical protein
MEGSDMAKTNAERQAEYKDRTRVDGRQLNVWVSGESYLALGRLARYYGKSRKAVIEYLVLAWDAEQQRQLDDDAHEEYIKLPSNR